MLVTLHNGAFKSRAAVPHRDYRRVKVTEDLRGVDQGQRTGVAGLPVRTANVMARLTARAFVPPDNRCRGQSG